MRANWPTFHWPFCREAKDRGEGHPLCCHREVVTCGSRPSPEGPKEQEALEEQEQECAPGIRQQGKRQHRQAGQGAVLEKVQIRLGRARVLHLHDVPGRFRHHAIGGRFLDDGGVSAKGDGQQDQNQYREGEALQRESLQGFVLFCQDHRGRGRVESTAGV